MIAIPKINKTVSFAITCHDEGESLGNLLEQLVTFIEDNDTDDEIVILDDFSEDELTENILARYEEDYPFVSVHQRALERDFGTQKTYLNSLCKGDYIFQVDADELLAPELLENLHEILEANSVVDLFWVPRINTVEGLTDEHVRMWNWRVNEHGWVLFPDYQSRLYRNASWIIWVGKVHERIDGAEIIGHLPAEPEYCILHHKQIERQEKQNELYSEILQEMREEE